MDKHFCPHCSSDITCQDCFGVGTSLEWHYTNVPGTDSSLRVDGHCPACAGSGSRRDHLCARVTDWFVTPSQLSSLRDLIENPGYSLPGQRTIEVLSSHQPLARGDGLPAIIRLEAHPRVPRPEIGSAALHASTDWTGTAAPTLHSLVSGSFNSGPSFGQASASELNANWRAYIDDWIAEGAAALRSGGRAYLLRILVGTA